MRISDWSSDVCSSDLGSLWIKRRVKKLIERGRIHAGDSLLLRNEAFIRHVHGDLQRRLCRTLARAGLEHPELALLHGEFDVLHIAIMRFQDSENLSEFGIGLEIGRASCRDSVCQYVYFSGVAVDLQNKIKRII